jgi:putative peptidoglycan lipid II flippase
VLLIPAVAAASVGQINSLVNTILASTLTVGSISWLYYADRLLELPVGLVAVALGTVMLPHLSRMAAGEDTEQFQRTLDWGINLGLMLGLPAAVALYLLSEPLIAVIFMSFSSGAMTAHDVRMASHALDMFALALPGFVLVKILAPAFFAHEDTKSPLRYASGAVAANLIVSLATFRWFGHVGLAWATAVSAWTHVLLLYVGLKRRGLYTASVRLLPVLWKTVVASALLGVALVLIAGDINWLELPAFDRMSAIAALSVAGVVGYLGVLLVLGVRPRHLNHVSVA